MRTHRPFPATRRPPRAARGFTLTELLATVAVAAVVAAFAFPQLQVFVQNNARATRLNTLVAALTYARAESITRRRSLTLCPSANIGTVPTPTCSGGNLYQTGFIILDGANLVRAFQPQGSGAFTLRGLAAGGTALDAVTFDPNGRVASGGANARYVYCDSRGQLGARGIVLSATGSPRMTRDTDGNNIDDVNGVDLTC